MCKIADEREFNAVRKYYFDILFWIPMSMFLVSLLFLICGVWRQVRYLGTDMNRR